MIPEIERKAVLALFPYFSKAPVVVDVGSNKGDWASVVAENVSQLHLFEPNTILRHYSRVRFRHLRHCKYFEVAVSDQSGRADFFYFEDEHDGLSNIIGNDKWDYLNPEKTTVPTMTLNMLSVTGEIPEKIDFLKIDVEGAEMKVLKGASSLFGNRSIKFLSVEYADHIEITGYKFQDIIDYLAQFDYAPFHYDGDRFIPVVNDPKSYNAENFYFMDKNFSQNWNLDFIENTRGMKCDFVLEIGAFEGLTSKYICENILRPGGRMIALDPLTDEYLPGHKDNAMFVGQYERFVRNTRGLPVELMRKRSQEAYDDLRHYRFDLIYVDGDHTEEGVYKDTWMAFELCKPHGIIIFDDYQGYDEGTTRGINRAFDLIAPNKWEVVSKGYQLVIRKLENLK